MKPRLMHALKWTISIGAIVGVALPIARTTGGLGPYGAGATVSASPLAQTAHHADRRHMHMRNWALEPTGKASVSPLDPASIPKYVNELTKPPVFVPDNPGRSIPHS